MAPRYKLKLKQLDFVSLVDDPAQPNAKCLLIKRRGNKDEIEATARLVKTSDDLGLAFFWAFTSTNPDGTPHHDLHGDAVQADNDMIRAAAEFMEKGGAVDEMHDYAQTGRVVFAMPMTPEIAKAFGVETKTSGLMIALRPSPDAMAKLKDGTYRAVSIAGLGERETVKSARVVKHNLATTEVDGHAHAIRVYDDGSMWVESATMTGAEYSHSHGLVRGEDGTLQILADSGHTHDLASDQPGVVIVPADAIVVVQARATLDDNRQIARSLHAKSTRSHEMPQAASITTEQSTMSQAPDLSKQLADLTKRNERLERIAKLSGAHKAHFDTLTGEDADAFLAKSATEREAAVQKALEDDKPIWTGEVTKVAVRKRDGELALQLAKQNEANAVALAKREAEIEKAEVAALAKAHLGKLTGDDEVHAYIVASVRKGGGSTELLQKAFTAMKGWNEIAAAKATAPGFNPGTDPQPVNKASAFAALEKGLTEFAKAKNIPNVWTEGLAAFQQTPEGKALADAYNATLA